VKLVCVHFIAEEREFITKIAFRHIRHFKTTAKYSDIDINGHVNSIRYIEHILDLFPIELYKTKRIRRFEMAYVAESYFGDELSFFCDEVNANEFHVEVKKNGNEVVCRSKVIFE
jgi:acyl-ACP thioesterase